jgi:hypothetical protein
MNRTAILPQDVRDAIDSDLDRLGISEAALGHRLGMTQQAINKWRRMGVVPFRRFDEIVAALGSDSAFAKLGVDGLFAAKENRHNIITKAVSEGTISWDDAQLILLRGGPEPGAVVRDLRKVRGTVPEAQRLTQFQRMNNINSFPRSKPRGFDDVEELKALLPERLRSYMGHNRLDYASPRLCLDFKVGTPEHKATPVNSILRVAAAKARGDAPTCAVAIVGTGEVPRVLGDDAEALKVQIWYEPDLEALARKIMAVEGVAVQEVEEEPEEYT